MDRARARTPTSGWPSSATRCSALAVTTHLYPRLEAERYGAGRLTKIRAQAVSGRVVPGGRRAARGARAPAGGGAGGVAPPARRALVETERVLASVIEAVIGACYLDYGYEHDRRRRWSRRSCRRSSRRWSTRRTSSRRCRSGWRAAAARRDLRGDGRGRARRTSGPSRWRARGGRRGGRRAAPGARRRTPSRRPPRAALEASGEADLMHLRSITLKGFKSFPDRTRLEFAPGRLGDRRPERLGQVERHRRRAVGDGRAVAARRPRPVDAGRDLRRRPRRAGALGGRGRGRARQRRRRGRPAAVARSRSSRRLDRAGEGEYRAQRRALPARRRARGAVATPAWARRCTRSSRRAASRRSSPPSRATGGC